MAKPFHSDLRCEVSNENDKRQVKIEEEGTHAERDQLLHNYVCQKLNNLAIRYYGTDTWSGEKILKGTDTWKDKMVVGLYFLNMNRNTKAKCLIIIYKDWKWKAGHN